MTELTVYGRTGWGSALIESQLTWYGLPYRFVDVGDVLADRTARRTLEAINPLAQVPTLKLGDGTVMTESAAITLWLADQTDCTDLVPPVGVAERPAFLRWLVFIVSNIYPTFTYGDHAGRFVGGEAVRAAFVDEVTAYAKRLYTLLNDTSSEPWFLGDRFSALDIYIAVLSHWNPGRAWFEETTPKLFAISNQSKAIPRLAEFWSTQYPD